ncbi:hypothetical protein [uncultured Prevotella sp.]|uniref:hypothetical protein n=1 Tax=uncultured Prevotella sp. TaxID=159272 RepID=UPI0027E263C1|nr:hypothetical protein [uncultured Prevotella sp.]
MTITFKEFKNNIKADATVFLGSFRWDEADKTRGREVSVVRFGYKDKYNCLDVSSFPSLPLADNYKMDVYTDYNVGGWGTHYVNEESAVDFNSNRFYIIAPAFVKDVEKAYNRVNDAKRCSINARVLASASEACATWLRRSDYLKGKNEVELLEGMLTLDACENDNRKRENAVRRTLGFAEKAFAKFLRKEGFANGDEYLARLEQETKAKAATERAEKAAEKKRVRDIEYVNSHIFYENGEHVGYDFETFIERTINTGTHVMYRTCSVGNENSLTCEEENDYNGYSRRCQFTMIKRGFRLTVKKGYSIRLVGGLITFYRGEFKRDGMACEWVEQGRAIADIVTKKGYLVRGEHIEAKTLKEAKRINAEKRKQQAFDLLNARAKRAQKAAEKKQRMEELAKYMFTFDDSLNAGNCRPGTQNFKNLVEKEVGHEVNEISLADLRKYGRMFDLSYYIDRVINYVMNRK